MEIKGFITNLGKYNEGRLIGKWITFPIDEDELNEVFAEIGCYYVDEDGEHNFNYEEYFFTDWDCSFPHDLGEFESVEKINDFAELLEDWDEETFCAACAVWGTVLLNVLPDWY